MTKREFEEMLFRIVDEYAEWEYEQLAKGQMRYAQSGTISGLYSYLETLPEALPNNNGSGGSEDAMPSSSSSSPRGKQ